MHQAQLARKTQGMLHVGMANLDIHSKGQMFKYFRVCRDSPINIVVVDTNCQDTGGIWIDEELVRLGLATFNAGIHMTKDTSGILLMDLDSG